MDVRIALLSDKAWIVDSQLIMAEESEGLKLDRTTLKDGVQAVMDDSSKGIYYIAHNGASAVGMLLCMSEWSDWRNCNVLWVHSVFVEKNHRKKGVFNALYSHLKTMVLGDSSLAGIRLYVDKNNNGAKDVYKKLGMTDEHYSMYEWLKDG